MLANHRQLQLPRRRWPWRARLASFHVVLDYTDASCILYSSNLLALHSPHMATLVTSRNPLATMKPLVNHVSATIAPWQTSSRKPSSTSKRAHSPEPGDSQSQSAKRPRAVSEHARTTRDDVRKKEAKETREPKEDKDRRRAEREEEFRYKYTRAFPSWTFCFHFDADTPELAAVKHKLQRRVEQMGAVRQLFPWVDSVAHHHENEN